MVTVLLEMSIFFGHTYTRIFEFIERICCFRNIVFKMGT
jgi:hypothetical protein